ncbi:MAG TPA: DUF2339 domain-containing protein, partial [Gemmatimonadales bacterium]|nr:DUF2339 domain-containing protein [Gemmatimonadales bacterium]
MSENDRMERLEARVARLEELLAGKQGSGEPGKPEGERKSGGAPTSPTQPRAGDISASPPPYVPPSPLSRFPASPLSSEQFIGQRVLLAVGVVALILAAGYLLRLSFDRGWISPLMRCVGGATAGVVVGAVGWRLHPRYRTYGAALIGCGAA